MDRGNSAVLVNRPGFRLYFEGVILKALFGLWSDMKVADINRILKPHGVKLVSKSSKAWGKQVTVTAHPIGTAAKRSRAPKVPPANEYPPAAGATELPPGAANAFDGGAGAHGQG